MKRFLILLAAISLSTVSAHARLGATMAQCVERYGNPISKGEYGTLFNKNGFYVAVKFKDDHAVFLTYRKDTKAAEPLSETETRILLANNGNGTEWKTLREDIESSILINLDETLVARVHAIRPIIQFSTAENVKQWSDKRTAQETASVNSI